MVLAGFPWFGVWGRDTFIAMRGLLIARGKLEMAAGILLAWAEMVSEGMLPNRFPDDDGPAEYNTVDASLWFVIAVHEVIEAGGASRAEVLRLREAALAILAGYMAGTPVRHRRRPARRAAAGRRTRRAAHLDGRQGG